jgi:iron complex outermembrane receptor protein
VFDTTNCNAARGTNDAAGIAAYCGSVQEVMFLASGNADLDAEESDHLSLGVDWSVTDFWDVSVDYWAIDNDQAVRNSPQFYIDNESTFTGNVVRDPGGDITTVLSPFENIASQELSGVDMNTTLRFDVGSVGAFEARLSTAYLGSFKEQNSAGEPENDIAGEDGYPEWRAQMSLFWTRSDYAASIAVHYTDGYERPVADDTIGSWTTVDMQLNWNPAMLKGGAIALGLDNAFDEAPPEDAFLEGWPFFNRALYDPRGRLFYLRYSHDF